MFKVEVGMLFSVGKMGYAEDCIVRVDIELNSGLEKLKMMDRGCRLGVTERSLRLVFMACAMDDYFVGLAYGRRVAESGFFWGKSDGVETWFIQCMEGIKTCAHGHIIGNCFRRSMEVFLILC